MTPVMVNLAACLGGVPPGTYRARFRSIEDTSHAEYGDGLRFVFEVVSGEYAGRTASRITPSTVTPLNWTGRLFAGLAGRSLTPGDVIDVDEYIGREFVIQVEETPGGGTRVVSVTPADLA